MSIIKNIKKKIVPVKFDMSGWSNAPFLNKKTLQQIIKSLEQLPKSSDEPANSDTEHSYKEFTDKALPIFNKIIGSLNEINDQAVVLYVGGIKEILKLCEKYLSKSHNPLYSSSRIKGIKKIKGLCTKSLTDINEGSVEGWSVPDSALVSLRKKW